MGLKKNNSAKNGTVIGSDVKLDAALMSGSGTVVIEGQYNGDITIEGDLILEKGGQIKGSISAKFALISGSITGNVKCAETLHITSTGLINGDIESNSVVMDDGAVFVGYSHMSPPTDPIASILDPA